MVDHPPKSEIGGWREQVIHPRIFILIFVLSLGGCKFSSDPRSQKKGDEPSEPITLTADQESRIQKMCHDLDRSISNYRWGIKTCDGIQWKTEMDSVENRPLIWTEFGNPYSANKTLILSMVHPDEITPLYLGFQLTHWLKDREKEFKDIHVIVAPFINPDGHFRRPPIRMNARGVDVNRNFPTKDWDTHALKIWKGQLNSNKRRFPGLKAASEPETEFQRKLIKRFSPKKILSIHAPLNITDYDGPSNLTLDKFPKEYVQECVRLRNRLRATSTGFFPGSLGNYSGQEMGIPTITLELPSANPKQAALFWKKFQPGIHSMIEFKIEKEEKVTP